MSSSSSQQSVPTPADPTPADPIPAGAASPPPISRSRQPVTVAGIALGLAGGFAPVYFGTLSVFLQPVSEELGWGRARASLGGVISMLGLAVGSIIVGRLVDRWGALRVIPVSALLMAIAIAVQSQTGGSFALYALLGFVVGMVGAATTPPGYMVILARAFHGRLGLALGLAGVGMGIGHILTPIIAQALIAQFGWRGAYLGLALLVAVMGLLSCAIIARFGVTDRHASVAASTRAPSAQWGTLFRDARFWRLATMVLLVSTFTMGISIHLVSMLRDSGVSAASAAQAASFAGIGVLLGRMISGFLIDRYPARFVAAAFFLVAVTGALLLTVTITGAVGIFFLAGLLIGFSMGAEGDFLPFFVRRYFDVASFGAIFGVLFFVHSLGGVVGPYLFGLSYDNWSSYSPALWAAAVALGAASVLVISLGPYRNGVSTTSPADALSAK